MHVKSLAIVAAGVSAAALLAGCSSSSDSSSSAASASMVGGMTECTDAILTKAADDAAKALSADNVFTFESLQCADGWAVVNGIVGPADAPSDGPQGAPTSLIFQAEGQFWVPQDKEKVCGTVASASAGAAPADATVPAALYEAGCLAG